MVMIAVLAHSMLTVGWYSCCTTSIGCSGGRQRLLPVLQQGYNAVTTIFGADIFDDGLDLLSQPMPTHTGEGAFLPLPFEKSIRLKISVSDMLLLESGFAPCPSKSKENVLALSAEQVPVKVRFWIS